MMKSILAFDQKGFGSFELHEVYELIDFSFCVLCYFHFFTFIPYELEYVSASKCVCVCKRKPNYNKLVLNYINVFPCKLLLTFRTLQLANQFVSVYVFQAEGQTNNSFTIKINLIIKYRNFRRKNIQTS